MIIRKEISQGSKEAVVIPQQYINRLSSLLKKLKVEKTPLDVEEGIFYSPTHLVGQISIGDFKIIITPKHKEMNYGRILQLYNYVYNDSVTVFNGAEAIRSVDDYKEFVIAEFIESLSRYVNNGLITNFTKIEKRGDVVKGKVNWQKTISNILKSEKKPINSKLSKTTIDCEGNKLIKLAIEILHLDKRYRSLLSLSFNSFSLIESQFNTSRRILRKSPKFNSIKKLINLSEMIVMNYRSIGAGEEIDEAFLVNYDKLFEDYIAKLLAKYGGGHFVSYFEKMIFGQIVSEGSDIGDKEYKPDYIYRYNAKTRTCQSVLDAKNKVKKYNNSDVFEILQYSAFLDAKSAIFIYPCFSDITNVETLRITNPFSKMKAIYAVAVNMKSSNYSEVGNKLIADLDKVMFL